MAQTKSTKKAADTPKVMDVKKTTAASPTSRQVIVENRSIAQDPMMAQVSKLTGSTAPAPAEPIPGEVGPVEHAPEAAGVPELTPDAKKAAIKITRENKAIQETERLEPTDSETGTPLPPSKKRIVIQPISAATSEKSSAETVAEPTPAPKTAKSEPTIADLAKPDPLEGMKPNPPKETKDEAPDAVKDGGADKADEPQETKDESKGETEDAPEPTQADDASTESDTKKDNALTDPDKSGDSVVVTDIDEKDAKKKAKKTPTGGELTAEQQKAVEAEEYFLPITTAETRRLRKELLFATLFILVVLVIWFDIMLDAELIKVNGVKAVTNFFK